MTYRIVDKDYARCRQWMKESGASSYCEEICIGLEKDGELIAAVGYGWFNGKSIHMHIAKTNGACVTREFLWFAFYYPFNVCGVEMIICLTQSGSKPDRIARHAGFCLSHVIHDAAPDSDMNIWVLSKQNAKLLNYKIRSYHGR